MKTIICLLVVGLLTLSTTMVHAQASYWKQATLSKHFKTDKEYKIAILPMVFSFDLENVDVQALQTTCRQKLAIELGENDNTTIIGTDQVDEAINMHKFGGSMLSTAAYTEVAKQVGANVIATCTFTREDKIAGQKVGAGLGVIQALIVLTEVSTGKVLYTGKARASNPLSLQDEAEYVIQLALYKMPGKSVSGKE